MSTGIAIQNQLLATKFFVPRAAGPVIARPRLLALLEQSQAYPLTLISAPAGFGKTTLLSTWVQSLHGSRACWLSLDEEENDPRLFWAYVLSALQTHDSERFSLLIEQLQSPQGHPLKQILTSFINLLAESAERYVLILDDYQRISTQEVHTTLAYVVKNLPRQLHIILATRADPPLPLPLQRARRQIHEIRTEQLRCTLQETQNFLSTVMGVAVSDETVEVVTARTEGWLIGLQLVGLSLPGQRDPAAFLEKVGGNQRHILDYLTQEVLEKQPADMQNFLLSTCILEKFTASLCDAVVGQPGSQRMLQRLGQTNLFIVSLDRKREWYRYHALFAEALSAHLERTQPDLLLQLHYRASLWYAEHNRAAEAIIHAFRACEWSWAADLIERIPLMSFTSWGASEYKQSMLQHWVEQLSAEIMSSRPRLCLACTQISWVAAPPSLLDAWLDAAESRLTTALTREAHEHVSPPELAAQAQEEQENLLGEVITFRAVLQSHEDKDRQSALPLCEKALTVLSAQNFLARAQVAIAKLWALYGSSVNDAVAAVESGLQAGRLAQSAEQPALAIAIMGTTAAHMIGTGQLSKAQQLTKQAIQLGTKPEGLTLPDVSWPTACQAEILREWNQLDVALSLAQEAITLCQQVESIVALPFVLLANTVLLRIFLSLGKFDEAYSASRQVDCIGTRMNPSASIFHRSLFTVVDQARLWLSCGEADRAMRWVEELDLVERHANPFTREREEVACARILLATAQPALALQRLEPALKHATAGSRQGHVLEIHILQAVAYQLLQNEQKSLSALNAAVRLGEPEGYIRSFLDEGVAIEALLFKLRKRECSLRPTPYLDTLLAAFQKDKQKNPIYHAKETVQPQILPEPLSEREQEVLQLLANGASNQEIAENLVIATNTVKRHFRQVLAKLGVQNRFHAVKQAQTLSMLNDS